MSFLSSHTNQNEKGDLKDAMKSRLFDNGPGEFDMLIGFFVMNGACIVFFLLFGSCVISSCMRSFRCSRTPTTKISKSLYSQDLILPKKNSPKINSSSDNGTKFKALVSKALKNENQSVIAEQTPIIKCSSSVKKESFSEIQNTENRSSAIAVRVEVSEMPSSNGTPLDKAEVEPIGQIESPPSLIRQNLLGPLSFDDLYYAKPIKHFVHRV